MITVSGPWWQLMLGAAAGVVLAEALVGFLKGVWKGYRKGRRD